MKQEKKTFKCAAGIEEKVIRRTKKKHVRTDIGHKREKCLTPLALI